MSKQPLRQGAIVYAEVPDPQGRNPKVRPLIVLTPDADLPTATQIVLVFVTTTFNAAALAENEIKLPWHRDAKCLTKLREPSVALCSYLPVVPKERIVEIRGCVSNALLSAIEVKVQSLKPSS